MPCISFSLVCYCWPMTYRESASSNGYYDSPSEWHQIRLDHSGLTGTFDLIQGCLLHFSRAVGKKLTNGYAFVFRAFRKNQTLTTTTRIDSTAIDRGCSSFCVVVSV